MLFQSEQSIDVKQIGTTLVAAFHAANPPLIWKFDLERNHSFTLALQGEEGDWELGVTSPKGEFYPVARFLAREDAEGAFAKTQRALMAGKRNPWRLAVLICGAVLLVLFLLMTVSHFVLHRAATMKTIPMSSRAPMEMKEGVPLPADDVLKPPP